LRPHIPARVWMNWVQMGSAARTYRVLTVRRAEIECYCVPPGEAAHFVSAAPLIAVQPSRIMP
jgi:hypothetical protein